MKQPYMTEENRSFMA